MRSVFRAILLAVTAEVFVSLYLDLVFGSKYHAIGLYCTNLLGAAIDG